MWAQYYECVHKRKGMVHVVCKYCHKPFLHPNMIGKNTGMTGDATTSLSHHLKECMAYIKQKPILQSSITDFTTYVTVKKVDNDQLTKVLKFFISGNITFNEANNPYFQDLIWTAHGTKNQPINRKNV